MSLLDSMIQESDETHNDYPLNSIEIVTLVDLIYRERARMIDQFNWRPYSTRVQALHNMMHHVRACSDSCDEFMSTNEVVELK